MTKAKDLINPTYSQSGVELNKGLTKREYFAAMAMQGMLASANNTLFDYETIATHSVKHADALINALNDKP